MKRDGCWIFLSHSSRDIHTVRKIRNEFEKYSHNPLAFHLKCLNADTPEGKNEIDALIKREIDSREWFVFCDSPAARMSEYVRMERDYIHGNDKKKIWTIDMTASIDAILARVREICTLIKVYISFSAKDAQEAFTMLKRQLIEKDFDVWDSEEDLAFGPISQQIQESIKDVADNGFIIVLITEGYLQSEICLKELEWIVATGRYIIPIIFGNAKAPLSLAKFMSYYVPHTPNAKDIDLFVQLVEAELMKCLEDKDVQTNAMEKVHKINTAYNFVKWLINAGQYDQAKEILLHSFDRNTMTTLRNYLDDTEYYRYYQIWQWVDMFPQEYPVHELINKLIEIVTYPKKYIVSCYAHRSFQISLFILSSIMDSGRYREAFYALMRMFYFAGYFTSRASDDGETRDGWDKYYMARDAVTCIKKLEMKGFNIPEDVRDACEAMKLTYNYFHGDAHAGMFSGDYSILKEKMFFKDVCILSSTRKIGLCDKVAELQRDYNTTSLQLFLTNSDEEDKEYMLRCVRNGADVEQACRTSLDILDKGVSNENVQDAAKRKEYIRSVLADFVSDVL